ncbi:MAG: transcription elongation factor GreA [Rickettsiales bacterium]|jgi:transcription elongation factor GreA|nr:transcription elongation factor GreA [Rickettsiales bacterium]
MKPISQSGMDELLSELKQLREVERPPLMQAIQAARALGDLKENAEYQTAREKQRWMDRRIGELEKLITGSKVIDFSNATEGVASFGAVVELEDEAGKRVSYQLLGGTESDIAAGKISVSSPIGKALVGHKVGDLVSVHTPSGVKEYEIISVRF